MRNRGFWLNKFRVNIERDKRVCGELRRLGFRVLTLWECEVEDSVARIVLRVERFAGSSTTP